MGAEGQNGLPCPTAHAAFGASQGVVGLLGYESTLLVHVQLFIHRNLQDLLHSAALHDFSQLVLMSGIVLIQVQNLAVVEPYEVLMGPLLKIVQVPLVGIPSVVSNSPPSFLSSPNLLSVTGSHCIIDKDIEEQLSQDKGLEEHHSSPASTWS